MKKYLIALVAAGAALTCASTARAGVQIVFSTGYGRPPCYQPVRYYSPCPPPVIYYERPCYSYRSLRYLRCDEPRFDRGRIHRHYLIERGYNRGYRW